MVSVWIAIRAARPVRQLCTKPAATIALFVLLVAVPHFVPALDRLQIPLLLGGEFRSGVVPPESPGSDQSETRVGLAATEGSAALQNGAGEVEGPSALDHFFKALVKAEVGGGIARICHYGDSPITNDGITATIRRRLQLRFGDAGHGFILAAKPWGWYGHVGVSHKASSGWSSDPLFISRGDQMYGLGGASFTTSAAGVTATFGTVEDGIVGRSVSRFDVYYLAQPAGGDFEVEVDGQTLDRISTASSVPQSAYHAINLTEGAHEMTIRTVGNGQVRLFGVVLEAGTRGVQYDSLGLNGAFVDLLARYINPDHWADQLRHRGPDLVILNYGTNESQFENLPMDQYETDTKEAIRRIRAALPAVSIMLVGPMDRAKRGKDGALVTRPMISKLVAYQRRLAAENGCAFFDTFSAMGGEGTAARWREARPPLMGGDFTHPTAQGAEVVGTLIYDALMRAYEKYAASTRAGP